MKRFIGALTLGVAFSGMSGISRADTIYNFEMSASPALETNRMFIEDSSICSDSPPECTSPGAQPFGDFGGTVGTSFVGGAPDFAGLLTGTGGMAGSGRFVDHNTAGNRSFYRVATGGGGGSISDSCADNVAFQRFTVDMRISAEMMSEGSASRHAFGFNQDNGNGRRVRIEPTAGGGNSIQFTFVNTSVDPGNGNDGSFTVPNNTSNPSHFHMIRVSVNPTVVNDNTVTVYDLEHQTGGNWDLLFTYTNITSGSGMAPLSFTQGCCAASPLTGCNGTSDPVSCGAGTPTCNPRSSQRAGLAPGDASGSNTTYDKWSADWIRMDITKALGAADPIVMGTAASNTPADMTAPTFGTFSPTVTSSTTPTFTISNVQDTGVGLNVDVKTSGAWGPEFRYSLDGGSTYTQWLGRHALHSKATTIGTSWYQDFYNNNPPLGSNYTVASGDKLVYDIYIKNATNKASGAVDLAFTDTTKLSTTGIKDQNNVCAHPATNLSTAAGGNLRWYHREFDLSTKAGSGNAVKAFQLAHDNTTGAITGCGINGAGDDSPSEFYVRNVMIVNGTQIKLLAFDPYSTQQSSTLVGAGAGTASTTNTGYAGSTGLAGIATYEVALDPSSPVSCTGSNGSTAAETMTFVMNDPASGTLWALAPGSNNRIQYRIQDMNTNEVIATSTVTIANPRHPVAWRSVRSHSGIGDIPIALNATATGNNSVGTGGPNIETRGTNAAGGVGITRIQVDFNDTASAPNPAQISVTGYTTTYPGGTATLGSPTGYSAATANMISATTLEMTFSPALPDQSCFVISLGANAIAETVDQIADHDVMVRGLNVDANLSGTVTNSDVLLTKSKFVGTPPNGPTADAVNQIYDYNLNGLVNNSDVLYCKAQLIAQAFARAALCP